METDTNSADFASLAEAKAAYSAIKGDLDAAQSLADEAGAKVEALTQELADANAKLESAGAELGAIKTESAAKIEALSAEVEQLKADAKSAEQRAAEIAASSGTVPVETAPGQQNANAWETYQAIKDPAEKTAYWRANQDAIIAAARRG